MFLTNALFAAGVNKLDGNDPRFTPEAQKAIPVTGTPNAKLNEGLPEVSKDVPAANDYGSFSSLVYAHSGQVPSPAMNNIIQAVWQGRSGFGMDTLVRNALSRIKTSGIQV